MKPLFDGQQGHKKIDFGDAVISNAKYSCAKCPLKKLGCTYVENSLNCEIANVRMRKILEEENDKKMENEQNSAMKDYLDSLGEEKPSEEQLRQMREQEKEDDDD